MVESQVGTNAIGTALATKEPMQIIGFEHYSKASHRWSCFSAPIRNDRNEIIGIIDVSTMKVHDDLDILSAVFSVACSIEHKWKLQQQQHRLNLLETYLHRKENDADKDFLIFDNDGYFVTSSKSLMPRMKEHVNFHMHMMDVADLSIVEHSRHPILLHGQKMGYKIEVLHKTSDPVFPVPYKEPPSPLFVGERGISGAFQKTIEQIQKLAQSDITVFIHGESGTGKELIAKSIHLNSPRKKKPFVAINCGAIPKELMESELFGYEAGAFTGAKKGGHKGKFVQADGGTIFLDEIGDMPLSMQVALLRVIQEREITPIGGHIPHAIDVRIITATHKNVHDLVEAGVFREDLFYRLHVFSIKAPSLHERKEDIPYLIAHFCEKHEWQIEIPDSIMKYFLSYTWPGNIRELFNILERLRVLSEGDILSVDHLPSSMLQQCCIQQQNTSKPSQLSYKEQLKRASLIKALEKTNGNAREAAELLGISLSTIYRQIKKYTL
ncbi:sigma-54-dependent Fis family transcriptional regulator [Aneurinibacillus sp. REN35]|uniref:sigma-54-dependent Fis family transcriptional regulator n=1 Tax=Aneurinibacillus sp. REN35 TaxID=3237286 RepID=UPI0035275AB9